MWQFPLFPDQASTVAHQIDTMYFGLLGLAALFGFGVAIAILYFAVKYRANADVDRSGARTDNRGLEMTWTLVPLGIAVVVFIWGASLYYDVQTPPEGETLEIYAVGKQWMWKFQHQNGVREINTLHVPMHRSVRMIMTSEDVIHSFYVPAFRVKQDVLPGRYSTTWFEATREGSFHLFCAEYCGTEHARMGGRVQVMTPEAYERWLQVGDEEEADGTGRYRADRLGAGSPVPGLAADTPAMAAAGAALFRELRCVSCHRTDSTALAPSTGPVLEGLYGRLARLRNERRVLADEQYLLESILYPSAKLAQGYPPVMPTYAGQLSDEEAMQLVAYLKTLSEARGLDRTGEARGLDTTGEARGLDTTGEAPDTTGTPATSNELGG